MGFMAEIWKNSRYGKGETQVGAGVVGNHHSGFKALALN